MVIAGRRDTAMAGGREASVDPSSHVLDPDRLPDHIDRLYSAAWALCGSRHDAEDLVQDTIACVLRRPRILRGDSEGDIYYLLRALRNTFLSQRRATARRPRASDVALEDLVLPETSGSAADPPAATEARYVYDAIAALPDEFRDALVAIDVAGLSYREAAKLLRVREGTITSRVYGARGRVAEAIRAQDVTRGSTGWHRASNPGLLDVYGTPAIRRRPRNEELGSSSLPVSPAHVRIREPVRSPKACPKAVPSGRLMRAPRRGR